MKHQLPKCLREAKQVKGSDLFSRLPDEIIVSHILSRFTLEEGARYSILSRRWKKLWACTIGSKLIFAPEHLRPTHLTKSTNDSVGHVRASFERPRKSMDNRAGQSRYSLDPKESIESRVNRLRACFECWISNVLQAYGRPKLDELTVRFPFDSSNRDSIDMWIDCALKKGVSRLELDLRCWCESDRMYRFPKIEKLQSMLANCGGLYNLRDVCLRHAPVTPHVIEFMLAHFPLERLCIWEAYIGRLSVSGVRLKSLELVNCIVDLKISASNLTSLTFTGPESSVVLEHVPHLSELSVDKYFCRTFLQTGFPNRGYISGLKRLEFAMSREAVRESINYPFEFPETLNLEELTIEMYGDEDACYLWPVLLIKAAPFLRKFSVKLYTMSSEWERLPRQLLINLRNAAKRVRHHQYLKTVELHDYFGYPSESELVQHLLSVSETLEQILVSPAPIDPKWIPMMRSQAAAAIAVATTKF